MPVAIPYWTTQMVPTPARHFAVQFNGAAWLTVAGGGAFFPHGPKNCIVAGWIKLASKAGFAMVFDAADPAGVAIDATHQVYGVQYDSGIDQFTVFTSDGGGFHQAVSGFSPGINRWYWFVAEMAGFTQAINITDDTGFTQGGSSANGAAYDHPASISMGMGSAQIIGGSRILPALSALDSIQIWNDVSTADFLSYFTAHPGPPDGWNGGKALDLSELPASAPPLSKLQLYCDFNDPSHSATYKDGSPAARVVSVNAGNNLIRIPGAGF